MGRRNKTCCTAVASEPVFLEYYLVAICLQRGQGVWLLGEEQSRLGRVAFLRGGLVDELMVPDFLLGLPVDNVAFLDGTTELDLAKVGTRIEVGGDVELLGAVSGDAIGNDAGVLVGGVVGHEAGFKGVAAVVEDERFGGR